MNATQPVAVHLRCSSLSHTYNDKEVRPFRGKSVFAVYHNHLIRKAQELPVAHHG